MSDRAAFTPAEALELLRRGNARFVDDRRRTGRTDPERRSELAGLQAPFATVIGCSDSRVPFEHIFDVGIGDVFVVRNAGHVVDDLTLGSAEFGTLVLGTPLLVLLRHTSCGAIRAALSTNQLHTSALDRVMDAISPSVDQAARDAGGRVLSADSDLDVELVGNSHRDRTMRFIVDHSPAIMEKVAGGDLALVGAIYDLETGTVVFDTILGNA